MTIVVDASICMAWSMEAERTSEAMAIMATVVTDGAVAPPLWRYEIAHSLLMAQRRGRLDGPARKRLLDDLSRFEIVMDSGSDDRVLGETANLADSHGLTVYDAAYLELAQRLRLPLATLDSALRQAAVEAGLTVLP